MRLLPLPGRVLPLLLLLIVIPVAGCPQRGAPDGAEDVKVAVAFQPAPPKVGQTLVVITLTDKDAQPVRGAMLKLEGNMNHAGMTPVFADAKETAPGQYEAPLEFTMGGDWFLQITGTLADGRKLSRKVNVPGVQSR